MAHFAQLDENNVVTNVIVVGDQNVYDPYLDAENEAVGILFCKRLFGEDTTWKQTSYNENFRYNYAGIGYTYDEENDAFISPKPHEGWSLDPNTFKWQPPVPMPTDSFNYNWDNNTQSWVSL